MIIIRGQGSPRCWTSRHKVRTWRDRKKASPSQNCFVQHPPRHFRLVLDGVKHGKEGKKHKLDINNYSSSSSATITPFESQKHDCWVIERKDQLEYRYEMSCTTVALNSKCLNLSWLRLPLICRWRSCVPLTAKNSVFWKHLNFFFLEITKKTYFQLFMDMFFPHTGWEGGGLTSSGKWRKLALNSFSEKFNVELFLSVVQSSEAEAKYWWRLKGQLPREGKHLAGLNLAKWCDWSVFVSLIDCDWSIFVSLYRKLEAFVSSCSMQTENIAKGTTDPRVEFWLRK